MDLNKFNIRDIVIIDCEASGLADNSYPIEVGVSLHEDSFGFLIKPEKNWTHWCKKAEKIHNISRESLHLGKSAHEAATLLNNQLRDTVIFSDAASYEIFWIDQLFKAAKLERFFEIESIYILPFDIEKYKKEKSRLSSFIITHRAENDAYIIRESIINAL